MNITTQILENSLITRKHSTFEEAKEESGCNKARKALNQTLTDGDEAKHEHAE